MTDRILSRRNFLKGLITAAAVVAVGPKVLTSKPAAPREYEVSIIGGHDGAQKKALMITKMRVGEVFLFAAKGGVPLDVSHILIDGKIWFKSDPHPMPGCVAFRLVPEAVAIA